MMVTLSIACPVQADVSNRATNWCTAEPGTAATFQISGGAVNRRGLSTFRRQLTCRRARFDNAIFVG
jgi:hypothetical protein